MFIKKYFDEKDGNGGGVRYDITGLTPNGYAAIVAALEAYADDKNSNGVLSCNADGLLRTITTFERANVDAVKADTAKRK